MLVLTRKQGERIMIGDGIEAIVLELRGTRVCLGLVAASEVRIQRQEVASRSEYQGSRAMTEFNGIEFSEKGT